MRIRETDSQIQAAQHILPTSRKAPTMNNRQTDKHAWRFCGGVGLLLRRKLF